MAYLEGLQGILFDMPHLDGPAPTGFTRGYGPFTDFEVTVARQILTSQLSAHYPIYPFDLANPPPWPSWTNLGIKSDEFESAKLVEPELPTAENAFGLRTQQDDLWSDEPQTEEDPVPHSSLFSHKASTEDLIYTFQHNIIGRFSGNNVTEIPREDKPPLYVISDIPSYGTLEHALGRWEAERAEKELEMRWRATKRVSENWLTKVEQARSHLRQHATVNKVTASTMSRIVAKDVQNNLVSLPGIAPWPKHHTLGQNVLLPPSHHRPQPATASAPPQHPAAGTPIVPPPFALAPVPMTSPPQGAQSASRQSPVKIDDWIQVPAAIEATPDSGGLSTTPRPLDPGVFPFDFQPPVTEPFTWPTAKPSQSASSSVSQVAATENKSQSPIFGGPLKPPFSRSTLSSGSFLQGNPARQHHPPSTTNAIPAAVPRWVRQAPLPKRAQPGPVQGSTQPATPQCPPPNSLPFQPSMTVPPQLQQFGGTRAQPGPLQGSTQPVTPQCPPPNSLHTVQPFQPSMTVPPQLQQFGGTSTGAPVTIGASTAQAKQAGTLGAPGSRAAVPTQTSIGASTAQAKQVGTLGAPGSRAAVPTQTLNQLVEVRPTNVPEPNSVHPFQGVSLGRAPPTPVPAPQMPDQGQKAVSGVPTQNTPQYHPVVQHLHILKDGPRITLKQVLSRQLSYAPYLLPLFTALFPESAPVPVEELSKKQPGKGVGGVEDKDFASHLRPVPPSESVLSILSSKQVERQEKGDPGWHVDLPRQKSSDVGSSHLAGSHAGASVVNQTNAIAIEKPVPERIKTITQQEDPERESLDTPITPHTVSTSIQTEQDDSTGHKRPLGERRIMTVKNGVSVVRRCYWFEPDVRAAATLRDLVNTIELGGSSRQLKLQAYYYRGENRLRGLLS